MTLIELVVESLFTVISVSFQYLTHWRSYSFYSVMTSLLSLQSNRENHEQQKDFWNVIVVQEKGQSDVRKLIKR